MSAEAGAEVSVLVALEAVAATNILVENPYPMALAIQPAMGCAPVVLPGIPKTMKGAVVPTAALEAL